MVGEDADRIVKELGGAAPATRVQSMEDAVREAFSASQPGDCVLLAPACASFDMFRGFEERGQVFKAAVARLGAAA